MIFGGLAMDCKHLKSIIDRQISEWMEVKPHQMVSGDETIRVTLPLLEPDGDVLCLYVAEREGGLLVHDGGHIGGVLYGMRQGGPTKHDRELVSYLLDQHGLRRDPEKGTVYIETDEDGLRFWLMELGWVVALVPFLIASTFTPEQRKRAPGGRTAEAVAQRLQEAGLDYAVERNKEMWGVSGRDWHIDFMYNAPGTALSKGKLVCVLTLDLDAPKPLKRADKTMATLLDLLGQAPADAQCEYGLVYSVGNDSWAHHPAAWLLAAAGEHSQLITYCWDDEEQQERFIDRVRQDLDACVSAP